jgi:hypothetical protein
MANYTTSQDIVNDILVRGAEPTDGTSDFDADVVTWLNRAYLGILSGGSELDPDVNEIWWWLRSDDQGVLTLNPITNTGTINVTNNSTSVTFSSAPAASQAGRHFKVDDHADVFIISSHTGGSTSATLESVYTGTTNTTASFRVFQVDYDLASDVLYVAQAMTAFQSNRVEIKGIDLTILKKKWPINEIGPGVPRNFAMIGDQKVRFSHSGGIDSTDLIKVDYEYAKIPTDLADDSSSPLVPRKYRYILADWALAILLSVKDDSKAGDMAKLAQSGIRSMARENRMRMNRMSGNNMGKIRPRQNQLTLGLRPLRTESGLLITG